MISFDRSRLFQKRSPDPANAARDVIRQLMDHRDTDSRKEPEPALATHERQAYQAAIRRVMARLPEQASRVEAQLRAARAELDCLLQAGPKERAALVARCPEGFRGPVLVDLLIQHSRRLLVWNLEEALDLAHWASRVAERHFENPGTADVAVTAVARAGAHLANALRKLGRLELAEPMLERALELFDRSGTGDVLVEAEILELTALLRIAQGRFPEAEALVSMAVGLYEECEAFERIGPVLAEKAAALAEAGELFDAIDSLEEALAQLEVERRPDVFNWALQNQAFFLLRAKLPVDAAEILSTIELSPTGPVVSWLASRQLWLEAEVAVQSGNGQGAARPKAELERRLAELGVAEDERQSQRLPLALRLGCPWEGEEGPRRPLQSVA